MAGVCKHTVWCLASWLLCASLLALGKSESVEQLGHRRRLLGNDHRYQLKDPVPLYAAKVGPFANPSETYEYYKLPYCKPKEGVRYKTLGMGEVVDANRMATTPYALNFMVDRKDEKVCDKTLTDEDMVIFRKAVMDDWYFQMYYDDLPVWGFIGKV
eukprot:GHUV01012213.1.p1 GENE.GHUV01012213.1~~GHUV01012213.1.p1  ORF type:complete len:157 (+),score=23.99 GHUV01012213.1:127-597(+)